MNPYENHADQMIAVAKILGRLYIGGHISGDELATMQAGLMHVPEPFPIISSPVYNPPVTIWGGNNPYPKGTAQGTAVVPLGGSIGILNTKGSGTINPYTLTNLPH